MRRRDNSQVSFFCGASIILFIFAVFFLLLPPEHEENRDRDYDSMTNTVRIIRMTLILNFIIFGSAFCIKVFLDYRINYLYIFELDPHRKVTHHQLFRVGLILLTIQMFCFAATCIQIKLRYFFVSETPWFLMALLVIFTVYCI